ncbi:hypothetical protein [Xanthomonas sp. 4461]|uniref:Uncharacterized protein n=1 Tax=Xanthomonas sp. 10-10 TaxID=3115848 RepID=A0AAU7PEX8_9XANT|nr:hypothetical protein [Xanthomonas sp. 4461]MCS3810993.1 hypothetical protein [Xanthomonas sp. 4461]
MKLERSFVRSNACLRVGRVRSITAGLDCRVLHLPRTSGAIIQCIDNAQAHR